MCAVSTECMVRSAFPFPKTFREADRAGPIGLMAAVIFGFLPAPDSAYLVPTVTWTIFGSSLLLLRNGPGWGETSGSRRARETALFQGFLQGAFQGSTAP